MNAQEHLIYATFRDGAAVIMNKVMIYHEDSDKGYHQEFTAKEVAERLSRATGKSLVTVAIADEALPSDWNFDDIEALALKRMTAS